MNTGKTLFAQLMDFLPWTTFTRIRPVWRRSPGPDAFLRRNTGPWPSPSSGKPADIEIASKLYHMGFRQPVRRSTLADANERRESMWPERCTSTKNWGWT